MSLGKYSFNNMICAFPDYKDVAAKIPTINRNGNLGNETLRRFNVVFDYSRETIYLKPNYAFREPYEHDMSGLEITTDGDNFEGIIIVRVEPNSSAEKLGLKPGDRILSVNFKKVPEFGIEEIHTLFKSRENRGIVLEVKYSNSKESKFMILSLQRRI